MSSFFSRCLSCGIDLPNGCRFCGEYCRDQWHEKHEGEAVAIVATDEVGNADVRERSDSIARQSAAAEGPRSQGETPAVRSEHDPRTCTHHRCRLPF